MLPPTPTQLYLVWIIFRLKIPFVTSCTISKWLKKNYILPYVAGRFLLLVRFLCLNIPPILLERVLDLSHFTWWIQIIWIRFYLKIVFRKFAIKHPKHLCRKFITITSVNMISEFGKQNCAKLKKYSYTIYCIRVHSIQSVLPKGKQCVPIKQDKSVLLLHFFELIIGFLREKTIITLVSWICYFMNLMKGSHFCIMSDTSL